jgi:hypothetical protein
VGQAIVKAAKDRDLYLIWSSVVDNAIWVGNRAELLEHLQREYRREHPDSTPNPGKAPEDRVARADRTGSSMIDPECYRWDDEALTVMEGSPPDGWYHIRRERLAEYAEALLRDDEAAAVALLECWQRFGDDEKAEG